MDYNDGEYMSNLDSQPTISKPENANSHIIKPNSKKILTFIYCIVFWNFGLCVAIFGPTLLDLACQTSSSLSAMSMLYFLQNFTSLIGVFVSGIILKKKRLMMPLCVAFMPVSKNILFLALVMIFLGFNMGCVDNIANLAILKLHSNNVSPYIQTMHFFYGVGAFITPLIVKSFLNSNFDIKITHSTFNCYNIEEILKTNKTYLDITAIASTMTAKLPKKPLGSLAASHLSTEVEELPSVLSKETEFTSNTKYAFWILAFIQLPAFIIMYAAKKKELVDTPSNDEEVIKVQEDSPWVFSIEYLRSRFAEIPSKELTFLVAAMVFLFEGLQASHGGYIFSYIVEVYDVKPNRFSGFKNSTQNQRIMNRHHHNHHSDEAYITALFWAFFSIGRLASIFIATKFSASFMILIDIIGCFISTGVMLFCSFFDAINSLYIATCLLGLFLSNTTPTVYSLTEIYIGSTPTLTSFVIICAASGEMVLPVIVASLFETAGPTSLLVIEFILTILAAILFVCFVLYARAHKNCYGTFSSFIWINSIDQQSESSNLINGSSGNYYSKMTEEDNL